MPANTNLHLHELRKEMSMRPATFRNMQTKEQIEALFQNAVPNNSFDFRLTVTNLSDFPIHANIFIRNIESSNNNEDFDMRNVFYLDEGLIYLNGEPYPLDLNSQEEVIIKIER